MNIDNINRRILLAAETARRWHGKRTEEDILAYVLQTELTHDEQVEATAHGLSQWVAGVLAEDECRSDEEVVERILAKYPAPRRLEKGCAPSC